MRRSVCRVAHLQSVANGTGSARSRLSALADIIDKLEIDNSPLPPMTDEEKAEKIKGCLDKLYLALRNQLPQE